MITKSGIGLGQLKSKVPIWGLRIVLIVLIISNIYLNITQTQNHLNSDIVNETTYKQQVCETKSLLPENWIHPHELHTNRLVVLFAPTYWITHNTLFAQELGVIFGMFLQLLLTAYLLKQLKVKETVILLCLCIYLGFNPQASVLHTYFDAYAGFILAFLLTLGIEINLVKNIDGIKSFKNWTFISKIMILFAISIFFGYGTPKLFIMLYAPIMITDLILYFKEHGFQHNLVYNNRFYSFVLNLLLTISNVIAYAFFLKSNIKYNPVPLTIGQLKDQLDWGNQSLRIEEVVSSLGLTIPAELISLNGILYLLQIVFITALLCAIIYLLFYSKNVFFMQITLMLIFSTILMMAYLLVTVTVFNTSRYYVCTSILAIIVICLAINEVVVNKLWWRKIPFILLLGILLLCYKIRPYDEMLFIPTATRDNLKEVTQFIEDNNFTTATASYWNAGLIRAYSNWNIQTRQFIGAPSQTPFLWITDESIYKPAYNNLPNALILTDEEEEKGYQDSGIAKILKDNHKIKEIGEFNIYSLKSSIFKTVFFPSKIGESYQYTFDQWPLYSNDDSYTIKDSEIVIEDGNQLFYGPYVDVNDGTYDISMEYEIDKNDTESFGTIKITQSNGQSILAEQKLMSDAKEVCLKNIELHNSKKLEVVIDVMAKTEVKLKKIVIKRVNE